MLSTKPDVYLFTAKEAGGMSKTNDINSFKPYTVWENFGFQ